MLFLEVRVFLYFCYYAFKHSTMTILLTKEKHAYLCVTFKELKDKKGLREVLFWSRQGPDPDRVPVMLGPVQSPGGSVWFNWTKKRFGFGDIESTISKNYLERLYRKSCVVSECEGAYWGPPFSKVMS